MAVYAGGAGFWFRVDPQPLLCRPETESHRGIAEAVPFCTARETNAQYFLNDELF